MNRYILVIVLLACAAVATRLVAASPEAIPTEAIKALVDRVHQIAQDKGTTSAQKTASQKDAVNEFRRKYDGRTVSIRYQIKDVAKKGSYSSDRSYTNSVVAKASDSEAAYTVFIASPDSTVMAFDVLRDVDTSVCRSGCC